MPQEFKKGLKIYSLVNSSSYVSAIAQNKLDRIKEQAPNNTFKTNDPLILQLEVSNGQLEKL